MEESNSPPNVQNINLHAKSHMWTDKSTRERLPVSPLMPNCIKWAQDGQLAFIADSCITISTFMNRELEMYLQEPPILSKSFIFLPETNLNEHIPLPIPVFKEALDTTLPTGSLSTFLLHEHERSQQNPKELSLSRNRGQAYLTACWGPQGSGPFDSCAIITLTALGRIALYVSESFHHNWKEVGVLSEYLYSFLNQIDFRLESEDNSHELDMTTSIEEYGHRCAMATTTTLAWSSYLPVTKNRADDVSLIAFSGRALTSVWVYKRYDFENNHHHESDLKDSGNVKGTEKEIFSMPIGCLDTTNYGWASASCWQQSRTQTLEQVQSMLFVLGTTEGNILLLDVSLSNLYTQESPLTSSLSIHRIITSPNSQPVFHVYLFQSVGLIAASGSRITVWNQDSNVERSWNAHAGNISGLDCNSFDDTIYSCGADGEIKLWNSLSGNQLSYSYVNPSDSGNRSSTSNHQNCKYALYGLAISPNAVQLACIYVIPPAARPNRKSQADVSYSRVSSGLEYFPTSLTSNEPQLIEFILSHVGSRIINTTDIVWFCLQQANSIALGDTMQGFSTNSLPSPIKKVLSQIQHGKSLSNTTNDSKESLQPFYVKLCQVLEQREEKQNELYSISPFIQLSYLIRVCMQPDDSLLTSHKEKISEIKRALHLKWAEACLKRLVQNLDHLLFNFSQAKESISALLMADYLAIHYDQKNLERANIVSAIYEKMASPAELKRWNKFLKLHENSNKENSNEIKFTTKVREFCFICQKPVPMTAISPVCDAGHQLDRCFLSFQLISSLTTWKCMGCGALANMIESHDDNQLPFYILEHNRHNSSYSYSSGKLKCQLCGNNCRFLLY